MAVISWLEEKLFSEAEDLSGTIDYIDADVLETALHIAKANHPKEYIAILEASQFDEDSIIIDGLNLIPKTFSDETSAVLHSYNIPNSPEYVGTVHSHPNGVVRPSDTDKNSFSRGRIHLILGWPYEDHNWQAYNQNGKPKQLHVIENGE